MVDKNQKKKKTTQTNKEPKKKEDNRPIIYVQRLSDYEHFAEAIFVGGIPAFIVRDTKSNIHNR